MPDLTMTRGARWAAVGLLVLVLIVGAGNLWATYDQVGAVRAAQSTASHSAASVVQLCQQGNEARAGIVSFGEYLVAISKPPPHESPAARRARKQLVATFLAHIHKTFAPRNCASRFS